MKVVRELRKLTADETDALADEKRRGKESVTANETADVSFERETALLMKIAEGNGRKAVGEKGVEAGRRRTWGQHRPRELYRE